MVELFKIFSTRELALIIWLTIFLTVILIWDKGRYHLKNLVKYTFNPRLTISYLSLIIYISGIIALLWQWGYWDISLLKDTIIWFLFSALGIFFGLNKVKDAGYFWKLLKGSITGVIIVQFLVNLYPFSLWIELLMLPLLVFLTMLNAYSEIATQANNEHKKVNSCLNWLLVIINLIYIGSAIYKTIVGFKIVHWIDVSKQFLLPVILTALSIPYFWILALYMKYESMFVGNHRIFKDKSKFEKLKIKLFVLYYGHFSFKRVYRVWKKIGFLAYDEGVNYKEYIRRVASPPTYKKSPIINKMSVKLFNDIDACCKSLLNLGLGEFSEWDKPHSFDEFYCSTGYYSIQPYGLSNLLLSLEGEERHIHRLELSLSIHNGAEREESILKFRECMESIFRLLSIQLPHNIYNSIFESIHFSYRNDSYSIDVTHEIIGRVESSVLSIKSN